MIPLPKCKSCTGGDLLLPEPTPAVEFMRITIGSGFHVRAHCHRCQAPVKVDLPGASGPKLFVPGHYFTAEEKAAMRVLPRDDAKRHCPVCGGEFDALENHHLAPREFFGEECERWPQVEVCRGCHERWHLLMGRNIGRHRKQAAE